MVDAFKSFCKSKNIAIEDVKLLVAVSGGIDSVVLAQLYSKIGLDFIIAHCNFGLRGKESDEDEKFVEDLASRIRVPFYSKTFETTLYAEAKGVSIQMAARELRYSWFEQIRKETNCNYIATAHHKGDIAETVLFNLAKGTGLEGLHGIKPVNGNMIRPLLFASREQIEQFAKKYKIIWRDDSSNASTKYSRNKIRHKVIPVLEKINPKTQEAIFSTSQRVSEAEQFLNYQVKELLNKASTIEGKNIFIDIKNLENIPGSTYVLHTILKPYGFNYAQSVIISKGLSSDSGKLFYSKNHVVNIDRSQLIISPLQGDYSSKYYLSDKPDNYTFDSFSLQTRIVQSESYLIDTRPSILAFDADKLKFPLKIRVWKKGDAFQPLGMKGKKKLSDFMIDAKIPVNLKNNVWVVVSGDSIAGVLNHRLDDRFKITNQTKTVFEIEWQ